MKKKKRILILAAIILAILVIPIPTGVYKDGGTRTYTALTYKIVDWHRLLEDGLYDNTRVYFFPDNLQSIDELWSIEEDNAVRSFVAEVLTIQDSLVTVEPVPNSPLRNSCDKIAFSAADLNDIEAEVGSIVRITYKGAVMESYPAQIHAIDWELSNELRYVDYTEQWLDKDRVGKSDCGFFEHLIITKIYANCFFAESAIPMPYEVKLNGILSDEWCVGDQVTCTYENTYYDQERNRFEADLLTITESSWKPDPNANYKPVIYLYPEKETQVSVQLLLDGWLTCTYPAYQNGWTVTASPDGTLTDAKGQTYNYLYWEGETFASYDLSKGFCVKGDDTASFLEEALEKLGLTRREANEFIVYWLPQMESNPYNLISFQTDRYTNAAKLMVSPEPDSFIRVFMAWKKADSFVPLPEQELNSAPRKGFTVVEWGGCELR